MITRVYRYANQYDAVKSYDNHIYNETESYDDEWLYINDYHETHTESGCMAVVINKNALDCFEARQNCDYSKYGFIKFGGRWFKTSD